MNMTHKLLATGALALFAGMSVHAEPQYVWYWTGKAGDGMWNNTTNWIKAAGSWTPRPNYGDTVVFTNDTPLSLSFAKFNGVEYFNVRKFKFKGSAPVYTRSALVFHGDARYTDPSEYPELYVETGSEVVSSNSVQMYNGGHLWKTGGGTYRIISSQSRTSQSPGGPSFTIAAGTWIAQLEPGQSYGAYNQNTNVIVEGGATFEIHGYNSMGGAGKWTLDGTLRLNGCGGETQIGTLTGTGRIERVAGASSTTLGLHPGTVGPQTFSGTIGPNVNVIIKRDKGRSDEEFIATLSNADTMKDVPLSGDLNALRFAPGVGDFNFKSLTFTSAANLNLADADGEPVNVHVTDVGTPANMSLGGSGDFCVASDLTLAGSVVTNTGRLVLENAKKLIVGSGTAAKDVDLSTLKGIVMTGGDIEINNTVPTTIASLTGKGGKFSSTKAVSFGEYAYQGRYGASSAVTIRDGGVTNLTFYPGTGSLTVSSGVYHATAAVCAWSGYANTKVPKTAAVMSGKTDLTVDGGEVWLKNYSSNSGYGHLKSVLVRTGGAFCCDQFMWRSAATAENPDTVTLDGGALVVPTSGYQYNMELPTSGADGKVRFYVGAKGGRVVTHGVRSIQLPEIQWRAPFETAPGVTDGGIAFFPRMSDMRFFNPVLVAGGMSLTEGRLVFDGYGQLETTPEFFGTGDFALTDTVLYMMPKASGEKTLRIAKDAMFSYGGNVGVALRTSTSAVGSPVPQHIEIGSLAARGPGSALIIYDYSSNLGTGSSSFKVLNGVATNAAGLVTQPVVLDMSSVQYLAAYDDQQGLVKFTNEKSAAAVQDGEVIGMSGSETLAANTVKRALAIRVPNWATLTIPETSRVCLGDGTNPALALIDNGGFSGKGKLDFGTSEGVISVGYHPYGAKVNCVLDGKSGVTYVARAVFGRFTVIGGENVYEGPTRITTVCVRPTKARAFSTGDVYVCGGERNGGKIQFTVPLTFENDFHVSGWGHQQNEWYETTGGYGALTFQTNDVVLAGKVEIVGQARLSAEKAGHSGILAGTVSGGTLTVYKGAGTVRLTGDNVHTGGTEVVNATLELAKGTGAGTGAVLLDAGVLKFVNTEPITFANEVTGVGTVVFAGTAPVTLTGAAFAKLPFKTFAAGTSIDVANAANNVYAPYFTGDTDLRGLELTVGGVAGVGTISNGRLTIAGDIQPGGPNALGTLSFAEGVFAAGAGAHYVCDIVGDAADKLEIAGDVDLSAISFTAVANGRVESGKSSVLTCTGARSGAFNAVTLPKRWMSVDYGAREAILDHTRPGALIIMR